MISTCPLCGNFRETCYYRVGDDLICREHPGHPLNEDRQRSHEVEVYPPLAVVR